MSSHHFVTDRQSTALCILGSHVDEEVLMQLLEWNALVITTEDLLDWLVSLEIHIDVVVGDDHAVQNDLPYDIEWIKGAHHVVIKELLDAGRAGRVVIVGQDPLSKRSDLQELSSVWYFQNRKIIPLPKGEEYTKWLPKGRRLAISTNDYRILDGDCTVHGEILETRNDGWIKIVADNELFIDEFL